MSAMEEQSPPRQWGQLACDVILVLGNGGAAQEDVDTTSVFERIDKLWTDSEKKELTEMFGGKKRKGITNSGFKFILTVFETDKTEAGLLLLCRLIDSIIWVLSSEGDRRREKAIVKMDAIAVLSRVIRRRLIQRIESEKNEMNLEIDRLLFKLLLNIGQKDSRFNLKIRMAGVVQVMSRLFLKYDDLLDTFYPLFIRISRSPRSGQMIGRQDGFVKRLTDKIAILNVSETAEHILLLDKHLQILFFILKNRRTRVQLIRESYCRTVVEMLEKHLKACSPKPARRLLSSIFGTTDESTTNAITSAHFEAIVTILAILRLLANNKRAKEELIALGVLEICAKKLRSMSDDEAKNGTKAKMVDSMCALSLRCMPTVPYPLENIRFPLDYPIPQTTPLTTTTSGPSHPGGRVRNSSSINISFDNGRSSDEDDGIDEEDEALNDQNMTENNQIFERSDDEDGKVTVCPPLPKTTKLTTTQLKMYSRFFKEFEKETASIPEYFRKEEESWKSFCQATQMAMPNRQHLPLDMFVGNNQNRKEELCTTTCSMRKMIVDDVDRTSERYSNVVYDLDAIVFDGGHPEPDQPTNLGKLDGTRDLIFESRFESGNLRRATQVAPTHYELMLTPDMNQLAEHYQWFFFQVSNTRKSIFYTFEIANCLKPTSMYSQGMQPVMFSLADRNDGWKRVGYNVCYYRNLYACSESTATTTTTTPGGRTNEDNGEEKKKKHYYSMRFNVVFPNTADVVYLAYHFPYTYSFLSASIHEFRRLNNSSLVYCREDILGYSIAGNAMRMLTITANSSPIKQIETKEVLVLSARVHPGESNSSWIMHGILEQLMTSTTPQINALRDRYVFKIIPMLNPDGVINGSHRCSLAGIDLNRVWDRPNESIHPEIYHTKAIVQYLASYKFLLKTRELLPNTVKGRYIFSEVANFKNDFLLQCEILNKRPVAFVDLHGHSKKWDYFVYGNNAAESWRQEDAVNDADDEHHLALPRALETVTNSKFNAGECRFSITRAKESSARVNVWRQFGVSWAYTLESTYCGFQTNTTNKGYQINIADLKDIGRELLYSFLEISNKEA